MERWSMKCKFLILRVDSQVVPELLGVLRRELLRASHRGKLRPPEAVGAEAVAILTLRREKEDGLAVLVLHPLHLQYQ